MAMSLKAIRAMLRRYQAMEKRALAEQKKGRGRGVASGARGKRPIQRRMSMARREELNTFLEDKFGTSPRHTDWASLAEQYPERFADQLRELEEQQSFEEEED